jgi:hypothetical protein
VRDTAYDNLFTVYFVGGFTVRWEKSLTAR